MKTDYPRWPSFSVFCSIQAIRGVQDCCCNFTTTHISTQCATCYCTDALKMNYVYLLCIYTITMCIRVNNGLGGRGGGGGGGGGGEGQPITAST